jgi:hypothetical protein
MTTVNFESETCCECGIIFQIPEDFSEDRQADGKTFYCPNGHGQNYIDCDDEKIEKLETANRELQVQVRQLKCKLIGKVGLRDRIRMWWRGGLA